MDERPYVLVVEDNRDAQELLVEVLVLSGLRAEGAGRGDDALAAINSQAPDVVVLDVDLPGQLNGLDVLAAIRKDENLEQVRVILLTAQHVSARTEAANAADLVLVKPVGAQDLVTLIWRVLSFPRES